MPFNYAEYQNKTSQMSTEQLQKEWENYTRQIAGGATSTATSVLFSPLTAGISLMGLGLSAPRIHNARRKREIIEKGLQERGSTHDTRTKDVVGSMALSGAISVATLGLAGPLADAAAGEAVGKGAEYAVAHLALDGVGEAIEHKHGGHLKSKAEQELKMKAMQAQLANMAYQNGGQQQMVMQNGQMVQGQWVNINGQMVWQQMPVIGGFQQPALTSGMALPAGGPMMQNIQQVQWQQPNPGMQLPTMQQPQMQVPGMAQDPYGQYTVTQQVQTTRQQYVGNPPQYQPTQMFQQDSKIQLNVIPNTQPQQQSDSKYQLHVVQNDQQPQMTATGFPNEKSAAYTNQFADGSMTPLPVYSQRPEEQPGHPTQIDMPQAMTMEEEIAMLKFKLLQLEMEKRGMSATISGPLEISLDEPKQKAPEQVVEQQVVTTREITTEVVAPQALPQSDTTVAQSTTHVESHVDTQIESQLQALILSAHPDSSSALPVPPVEVRSTTPQPPYNATAQPQQRYHPMQQQMMNTQVQQQPSVPAYQAQNTLVPPPIPAGRPVSPALPPQQYTSPPAPQQVQTQYNTMHRQPQTLIQPVASPQPQVQAYATQQQTPMYQPRPLNATIQPPQAASQPVQQYTQPDYQQAAVYPPAHIQRHDSGYYSQAATPLQRPVSSISSISSPTGRHPSISNIYQCAPPPQQPQHQQQYNQYNPAGYNPQLHGRSQSVASVNSVASPPPPAYFPPPPGQQPMLAGTTGGDYFGQVPQINAHPQSKGQQWQQQPQMTGGEINYGPPPPIPNRM